MKKLSLLQQHYRKWRNGCGAEICSNSNKPVFYRGEIPCDVIFVGEAPGESEEALGEPFVGPAGHLLDEWIVDASELSGRKGLRFGFCNLVCCLPDPEGDRKIGPPDEDSIKLCKPRLEEYLSICDCREDLKLIVCVGKIPTQWVDAKGFKHGVKRPRPEEVPVINLDHPAYVLRTNITFSGVLNQRNVAVLSEAFEEIEID